MSETYVPTKPAPSELKREAIGDADSVIRKLKTGGDDVWCGVGTMYGTAGWASALSGRRV